MDDVAGLQEAAGGRFSQFELIGRGSFGDVYKALLEPEATSWTFSLSQTSRYQEKLHRRLPRPDQVDTVHVHDLVSAVNVPYLLPDCPQPPDAFYTLWLRQR